MNDEDFKSVAEDLSYVLIKKNGLLKFILATLVDTSFETVETMDQRFRDLSYIVTNVPAIYCDPDDFFGSLCKQVILILSTGYADRQIEQLATYIFIALYEKNQSFGKAETMKPITDAICCKESYLTLTQSIICIHRLIDLSDFDKHPFIPVFPNILAIYTLLFETASPIATAAKEIAIDILKYVDQSKYILDASLYNLKNSINLYSTGLVKIGDDEMITVIPNSNLNDVSMDDDRVLDVMVAAISAVLDECRDELKLDIYLILYEKGHLPSLNALVCISLADPMKQDLPSHIRAHPNKAIPFLTSVLRRITSDSSGSIQSMMETKNMQEEIQSVQENKMLDIKIFSGWVQAVLNRFDVKDRFQLTGEELLLLKICKVYLTKVVTSELLSNSQRLDIQRLIGEINHLHETTKHSKIDNEDKFAEAVNRLKSEFMPQRAHGLVILRNLIDAQHQSKIYHKSELFTLIKACLSDPDSYVYLAAVNALASLALAHTESCLPTLVEAYHDRDRSLRDRFSAGESLVWVCKYLGQLAHHYHRLVVDCFLTGLKDENESIRVSSLSNLGQFWSFLKNALSYCIIEIVCVVECLLKTDSSLDVKRACLMFVYIMLNGIDNPEVILDHLKQIYHIIKAIDYKSLGDEIIRVRAHQVLEAIDNLMKKLITDTISLKVSDIHL
uniref:RNA polymerase II assembly factor Rtp1 C-terminal domain-containing protein n=1 Tax=Tetranychus urticae TaxID=32264 RepID=T1JSL4_TETUR